MTARLGWKAAVGSGRGVAQAGRYLFNQRPGGSATIGDGDPAAAQVRAAAANARR
ncbi:hypothetical protein ACOJBM_06365 [Rhizobium beringeri]